MKIILASNSPRRKEILSSFGFEVVTVPSAPENPPPDNLSVEEKVSFLALEKGLDAERLYPHLPVVSADTVVVLGDTIMGKPKDRENAIQMLSALSGKTHKVITAYTLFYKGERISRRAVTEVTFYELDEEEITAYVDTGDVYDKAGAYGIQGKGAALVKGINGDYLNVVGFPLADFLRSYLSAVK